MVTGMPEHGPLERLVTQADHAELCRLVTESAWRVDLRQAGTLHELFVDDGELEVGDTYRGRAQIQAWGRQIDAANAYPGIRHVTSNQRFIATQADSSGHDTATGTTVLTVYMKNGDGRNTSVPWVVGEDHDRFVRTTNGWRFTYRSWSQLFQRD